MQFAYCPIPYVPKLVLDCYCVLIDNVNVSDGKYHMLPTGSGELMIINVTKADTERRYRCRTHHTLTQEAVISAKAGQIRLTGRPTTNIYTLCVCVCVCCLLYTSRCV